LILTDEPFDQSRFARKNEEKIKLGINEIISTPEDVILMKLRWQNLSGMAVRNLAYRGYMKSL